MTDGEGRRRLLALLREDETVRVELMRSGELFEGYHPRMEAVHVANAHALEPLLATGWPTKAAVGEDGQEAAWLIAQHAISLPPFQRKYLLLLNEAVERGEAPAWQLAKLADRICLLECRPQRYGTQFDWDENGELSPNPIEDPSRVDELRAQVGLPPLAETTARHRRDAQDAGERAPADRARHEAEREAWARRVRWR